LISSRRIYERLEGLYVAYPPGEWLWLISYSGGKDSTALLLSTLRFAQGIGFKVGVVYNDCGGDLPELRGLVFKVLEYVRGLGHEVYVTRPERSFFDYLLTRYSPPRWNFRWCCKRIKELPFKRLAEELTRTRKVLNLVGVRAEEARWRNWYIKEVSGSLVYAAPLHDLRGGEVWSILREASQDLGLSWVYDELLKVYNNGSVERTGCWFCPLIVHDRMLESRPELARLKLEILNAWCSGRRERILKLSREHPDLIRTQVAEKEITAGYPCGRKCRDCQVNLVRKVLKNMQTTG
jgi:3'-phosphoadenosine 5'-phosphosulfate sulfotransferase (PAPS reductase)/FAD synthetase